MGRLDGKVALITGGARGQGAAEAEVFAAEGATVVITDVLDEEGAKTAARVGDAVAFVHHDVTSETDWGAVTAGVVDAHGRIDVLVNNAGITSQGRKDLLDATEESWDVVFNTNLKGPFFLAQLAAQQMMRQFEAGETPGGTIVNISSISALATSTNRADYCIAKAGMEMMTWLFADRLADHDIRVFDICPGVIASDMTEPVRQKYDRLIAEGLSPIRRWGQPDDVAFAVSAVAGGSFPFCTGQRIYVDGGFHIRRL